MRFEFGKNWLNFLSTVDEARISSSMDSLRAMLQLDSLAGKSFLDIGSGSGLSSLAASRLGAKVLSFDFDTNAVDCTKKLKNKFSSECDWTIMQGSALDDKFINSLGLFDFVYSWGVLHHTGEMWKALGLAAVPVAPGGTLFVAIYNDQGGASRRWTQVKKIYNQSPSFVQWLMVVFVGAYFLIRSALVKLIRFQNPFQSLIGKERGMTVWYDLVDWVGGYPFEVASPDAIVDFYTAKGFSLVKLKTCGSGHGCNEYVFRRNKA